MARHELTSFPALLSVKQTAVKPKGRPLGLDELRLIYQNAVPHAQTFILWALGTAARPEAVLTLRAVLVDWENGLVHLNPEGREQVAKKFRPVVRLPAALATRFEGALVTYNGARCKSIKKALWMACDRAGVERCSSYSFRHTAAREMRRAGVAPWECSAQLGHSMGKQYAVTERYAAYSPDYLQGASKALDGLVRSVRDAR